MTSKEKIKDIKSLINEFYHTEKCEGKLTECARKSWLVFQEYCDDILQDLECLEVIKCLKKRINLHQGSFDDSYYYLTLNIEKSELTKDEYLLLKKGFKL